MRAEQGYICFGECLHQWLEETFEKAKDSIIERSGASIPRNDSQLKKFAYSEVTSDFLEQLKKVRLYVFDGQRTLSVAREVLTMYPMGCLEEDFGGYDDIGANEGDFLLNDARAIRKRKTLPTFNDELLFYLEPTTWTIDSAGFDYIRDEIPSFFDHVEEERLQEEEIYTLENEDDEQLERWGQKAYWDRVTDDDNENYLVVQPSLSRFAEVREIPFPHHLWQKSSPFERLFGASLCLHERDWARVVEDSGSSTARVQRTIAAETEAVRKLRAFIEGNGAEGLRKDAARSVVPEIGARAFERVWSALRHDFPAISKPGRRREKP